MTLSLSLRHQLGDFTLDAAFEAPLGVTALFGRSGAGKTSLVNAVAGLLRPDAGRIALNDRVLFDSDRGINLPVRRRRVGYVFQDARLFPHLTVAGNLGYARQGGDIGAVARMLGIEPLLNRRPATLSGGERQRVAIGRALLSDPDLLLLDEPLAALDAPRKAEILPYLERLRDDLRVPILYVSHDLAEVGRLATTIVILEEGRVSRAGPAEEVLSDPGAVSLLGVREAGAVLPARVLAYHEADELTEMGTSAGRLWLPGRHGPPGAQLRVRILAQDVILSRDPPAGISALNLLPVTVVEIRAGRGPGVAVALRAGRDRLLARITRRSCEALGLEVGMTLTAIVKANAVAPLDVGEQTAVRV